MSLGVNNADITTLECALLERVYYCEVNGGYEEPPPVTAGTYSTRLSTFDSKLMERLGSSTPVSLGEIVEMYQGRKKTIYQNAKEKLERTGLTRKHGNLNVFVKMEKVNPDKAPRCIQPRTPEYTLACASYLKPIEKRIYEAIKHIFGDGPTVIKGMNLYQIGSVVRGKWRSFNKPVAIGLDAKKFDMHVSVDALKWEHSVYNRVFRCKKLRRWLTWQVDNQGFGYCKDGKLKFRTKGKRCSGDINTGLGNCLIMCGLVYTYAQLKGVPVKLCNNGDDCVVMMEQMYQETFMTGLDVWFKEMGFRMVAEEPVYDLNQIEFCQMRPIELDDGRCIMVRNIPTSLRKDSLCTLSIESAKALRGWMTAVGEGGMSLTGGIPVVQSFYRALCRIGGEVYTKVATECARHSGMALLSKGMERKYSEPSANVRFQVFKAWGILPDAQVELEKYYDGYQFDHGTPEVTDSHINYTNILNALSW